MATDQHLVRSLQTKDTAAYKFIYRKYGPVFFGLLSEELHDGDLCEELLVIIFQKIWQNIDQYDPVNSRLFTWMYLIAKGEINKRNTNYFPHGSEHPVVLH